MVLAGLVILGASLYSSMGRSDELKKLLKKRPKRNYKDPKLPKRPSIVDYADLYKKRIKNLEK